MSKTLQFKAFCFESYKAEHKLSGAETMRKFKEYGVLDYIDTCYDVLHCNGRNFIVDDIDAYIRART